MTRWMDKNRGGALLLLLFTLRSRREEHALTRPIKSRAVSGLNIDAIPRKIHGNICSLLFALRAKHTALFGLTRSPPRVEREKNDISRKSQKLDDSLISGLSFIDGGKIEERRKVFWDAWCARTRITEKRGRIITERERGRERIRGQDR